MYHVIGEVKLVQPDFEIVTSPLLMFETKFQVLPTKHCESAISKDFAEVPEGNVIPFYSAIFERQADGTEKFLGFK